MFAVACIAFNLSTRVTVNVSIGSEDSSTIVDIVKVPSPLTTETVDAESNDCGGRTGKSESAVVP